MKISPYCASVEASQIEWDRCIWIQGVGMRACRKCCYLATEKCTGKEYRQEILSGRYPAKGRGQDI